MSPVLSIDKSFNYPLPTLISQLEKKNFPLPIAKKHVLDKKHIPFNV